jgi:hypothetical protein
MPLWIRIVFGIMILNPDPWARQKKYADIVFLVDFSFFVIKSSLVDPDP